MSAPLELALIGAGRIARQHARAVAARDDVQITCVVDPDLAAASELAADAGASVVTATVDEVPEGVQGAIICSPTALHAEHATALVERGVAVLVEKPLASDLAAAEQLVRRAHERGVVVLSAQVLRYLPMTEVAREIVASGRFGRPVQVIERRLVDRADNYPWWRDMPAFLVSHWGSHSVDLVCHLFDDEVVRVACEADSVRSDFGVVDDFSLLARFGSGLRMTSSMSFSSRFETHDIVFIGTGATIVFEGYRAVTVDGVEVMRRDEEEMLDAAFSAQLDDFVATIRGGGREIATARSALPALDALSAAERAALASMAGADPS